MYEHFTQTLLLCLDWLEGFCLCTHMYVYTNDLSNWYLSLPSLALSINKVGQGLDWLAQHQDSVTEWDIG